MEHHRTVIEAAKAEGVELLAYTRIPNADATTMKLAVEHQETETILREAGVPFVLLRNGRYLENYTDQLPGTLAQGGIAGSAGEGRVSAASRADYAQAAAAVLVGEDQAGKIYELGGDEPFTMAEIAAEISAATGREISYQDLPAQEYAGMMAGVGVPEAFADILADSDPGIARGNLLVSTGDLRILIGRPPYPWPKLSAQPLPPLTCRRSVAALTVLSAAPRVRGSPWTDPFACQQPLGLCASRAQHSEALSAK